MSLWTEPQLHKLGGFMDRGFSQQECARHMGLTRGQVEGAARRQGWSFGHVRKDKTVRVPVRHAPRNPLNYDTKFVVRLDWPTRRQIEAEAARQGVSSAELIRTFIDWGLAADD